MNAPSKTPSLFGRLVRWLAIAICACLAPIIALGLVAASCLTLSGDGATLRKSIVEATGTEWETNVQFNIGRSLIGATNLGLKFAESHDDGVKDARIALSAVRNVSVGVYERSSKAVTWSNEAFFAKADRAMADRGWTRVIAVASDDENVLIYLPNGADGNDAMEVCLAVLSDDQLVIVSGAIEPEAMLKLVEKHACRDGIKRKDLTRVF